MTPSLHRPDPQELAMRRLMQIVSDDMRKDPRLETKLRLYLKIGGEKLARQYIESVQLPFGEPFEIVKRRPEDGEIEENEVVDGESSADEEEEDN